MRELDFQNAINKIKDNGFNPCPDTVSISIPNARRVLWDALVYFLGKEKAKWLPEYDRIAEWLTDNKGRGLLCVGNVGRGKSLFCTKIIPIILNHYCNKMVSVYDAIQLNDSNKTEEILRTHILCIDDIGTESESVRYGERRMIFPELIDRAEKDGKLLLLTTNLSESELSKKYGIRTTDRLHVVTRKVVITGESLRG